MKKLALILAISAAACGSKQQQPTTPSNSADAAKTGAMGGKTYGGAATKAPTPSTGDAPPADPCAAP
ncbi:MAG TPA: hypothetical protein VGM90_27865 [Kofleriaceae bacterium]|jgi:hypothetical protein